VINKLLGLAVALALPTLVAAQTPATHRRGDVVTVPHWRNPHAATPAVPGHGDVPTVPAKRATPAVPAHKGGQSGNHRP
jgi:hypothetical protein